MHLQFRKRRSDGVVFPLTGGQTTRNQRSQYTASLLQDLAENGRVMSELRGLSAQYYGLNSRLGTVDDQSEQFFNQYQSALLSGINMATVNEIARQNPRMAYYIMQQMTVADPGTNGQSQIYDMSKFKIYAPPSTATPYALSSLGSDKRYLYPIQSLNIVPLTPNIFMSLTPDDTMKFFIRSPEYPTTLFPVDLLTFDGEEKLINSLMDPKVQNDVLTNLRMFNQLIDAADAASGGAPLPQTLIQVQDSTSNAGQQQTPSVTIGGGQQGQAFTAQTQQRPPRQNTTTPPPKTPLSLEEREEQARRRHEDRNHFSIFETMPILRPSNSKQSQDLLDFTLMFSPKYRKTVDSIRSGGAKNKDAIINQDLLSQIMLFGLSKQLTPAQVITPIEGYVDSGYSRWNTSAFTPKEYADFIANGGARQTLTSLLMGFANRYGVIGDVAQEGLQPTPENVWNAINSNPQWRDSWAYIMGHPNDAKAFISIAGGGQNGKVSEHDIIIGPLKGQPAAPPNSGQYGAYTTFDDNNGGDSNGGSGFYIPGDDQGPRRAGGNPASHTTEGLYQQPPNKINISGWQNADTGFFIPPPIGGYGDSQGQEQQTGRSQREFTTSDGRTLTRGGEQPKTQQAPLSKELDRLMQMNKERIDIKSTPSSTVNIGVELSRQQKERDEAFRNTLNTLVNDQKLFTTEPDLNRANTEAAQAAPTNGAGAYVAGNPNIQYARTLKEQTVQISPVVTEMHPSLRRVTAMDERQLSGFLNSMQDSIENQLVNSPEERKRFKEDPEKYTYTAISNYLKRGHFSTGNDALDRELSEDDLIMDMEDYLENE